MDRDHLNGLDDRYEPEPELWTQDNWSPWTGASVQVASWWRNEDYGRTGTPVATDGIYTPLFRADTATGDGWDERSITNAYDLDRTDAGVWMFHVDARLNWRNSSVDSWETSPEGHG